MTEEGIIIYKSKSFVLGYCKCGCLKWIPLRNKKGYLQRFIHGHHTRLRIRELHPNYKGGKIKTSHGYMTILKPDHHFADSRGYIEEHRVVWEEHNNACLLPWADIHHKNIHNLSKEENKLDNTPENLQAMMHIDHIKLSMEELKKETATTQCIICGTVYMIYVAIKYKNKKCGRCYQREYMRKKRERLRIERLGTK